MKTTVLVLGIAFVLAACAPDNMNENRKALPARTNQAAVEKEKSTARQVIEGFTGKTAVDQYKNAKEKIAPANERGKQSKEDIDLLTKP